MFVPHSFGDMLVNDGQAHGNTNGSEFRHNTISMKKGLHRIHNCSFGVYLVTIVVIKIAPPGCLGLSQTTNQTIQSCGMAWKQIVSLYI